MDSDNNMVRLPPPRRAAPDLWPQGVTLIVLQLLWVVTEHGGRVRTGAGLRGNVNFSLTWNESVRECCKSTLFHLEVS